MRAVVRDRYGPPDLLEIRDVERPNPGPGEVLVRVRAASVNPFDLYATLGTPYIGRTQTGLRKPRTNRVGTDFAGVVEAVGENVTELREGDEVFGGRTGALGEYVCVRNAVARKPANATFEEAAAVPVAGITALQGLRDKGHLATGQRVLVNGASGGVGTFAVQIARALGGEVTAVCSPRNVETAGAIGAHAVVDYSREDFCAGERRYDLVLDVAGNRSWSELRRVLEPTATVVVAGGPKGNRLVGPLSRVARMYLGALRATQRLVFFVARLESADLDVLRELIEGGELTPVVDRTYSLEEAREAFRYLGEGRARGKVVVTI